MQESQVYNRDGNRVHEKLIVLTKCVHTRECQLYLHRCVLFVRIFKVVFVHLFFYLLYKYAIVTEVQTKL